ncbi:MAG: S1C family serine protease [Burkholderiales bacterium]
MSRVLSRLTFGPRRWLAPAALALLAGVHCPATAQPGGASAANTVFEAVSKSVVSVHVFEGKPGARKRVSLGSAVAIARGRVVTNCHVLAWGLSSATNPRELPIEVKVAGVRTALKARLAHADPARDLCVLEVAGLDAPPAVVGTTRGLKVGQPVYAVGAPRGLELTLSSGIISSLRRNLLGKDFPDDSVPIIQTDAAISGGSSGGGLFDGDGRLIGITSFGVRDGQNLNFARPAEWIRDLSLRGVDARDFADILAYWRKRRQGGAGAKGVAADGGRWVFAAKSPQGYSVYLDTGRLIRSGTQAQIWILHNCEAPVDRRSVDTVQSRVLLAEIDCAGARWTLRHAATYTAHFANGRRLSAEDLHPTEDDYRPTTPGGVMDTLRRAVCG